jgi:hypothetical protein
VKYFTLIITKEDGSQRYLVQNISNSPWNEKNFSYYGRTDERRSWDKIYPEVSRAYTFPTSSFYTIHDDFESFRPSGITISTPAREESSFYGRTYITSDELRGMYPSQSRATQFSLAEEAYNEYVRTNRSELRRRNEQREAEMRRQEEERNRQRRPWDRVRNWWNE